MKERDFQIHFTKWLKNRAYESAAYELKVARTGRLPIREVKEHQVAALLAASNGTFAFKIPDAGFQNPFDCFTLCKVPAYVVIYYGGNEAVMLTVEEFLRIKQTGVKSIPETLAREFGKIIQLKD